VGAALLYHYFSNKETEDEEEKFSELHSELADMGAVNRDASGMVTLQDFLKIFKVVTKHSKKQITKFKTENNDKRRKHLKDGDDEAYRECISQQITQEEAIYQEVATEVLSYLEIDEQEFMMAQNMHAMNPAFQKVMMEMQLGVEDGTSTKPSVTKEQAKEIFIFVEEEKSKAMENMRGAGMAGMNPNNMESTITMIVEHSKVGDKLFEKYGIEEEEFAKCIQYYNLVQDPDIQKLMQKSLMSMGPEALNMIAQMQGGGMGPPGGAPGGPGGNPFGAGF